MKLIVPAALVVGLFAAASVQAQTTAPATTAAPATSGSTMSTAPRTTPTTDAAPAAVSTSDNPRTTAAPVAGANSYTEGQAKARMEEKGYANVTALTKDDKGIWRATAMKDGKSTSVSLDYQGNVVAN